MKPLVSVIIPEFENEIYLVRCLNSIDRQTYENIEIILCGNKCPVNYKTEYAIKTISAENRENALNQAINIANGEYILFCSGTSILSYNMIDTLVKDTQPTSTFSYVSIMTPENRNFVKQKLAEFSIWGKLFCKALVQENRIEFIENSPLAEEIFLLKYLAFSGKTVEKEGADIYETASDIFMNTNKKNASEEEIESLLLLAKHISVNHLSEFVCNLFEQMMEKYPLKMLFKYVLFIAENLTNEKILNYELAKKYARKYYIALKEKNNEEMYQHFCIYLQNFDAEEEYISVILKALGIGKNQYKILKQYELKDYLFYLDKVEDETADSISAQIAKIQEVLNVERDRIDKLEKKFVPRGTNTVQYSDGASLEISKQDITGTEVILSGPELGEFVEKCYLEGRLGLRTILKSMFAWVKYKL